MTIMRFTMLMPLMLAPLIRAVSVCNGHAELCDRLYSNVTFIGAHDSYAVGDSIADNQDTELWWQLNDGVRTLQIQTHNATDGIHLCHSSCSLLDAGLLEIYLHTVREWVESNPTEVITLIIVNIDSLPATAFTEAFNTSGLSKHTYSPPSATLALSDWPTLNTLIEADSQVVVFMDYHADFASVPYIMDEFQNMWEDAYDVTTTGWECAVNRSSSSAGSTMMLINHFLDTTYTLGGTQVFVPNKDALNVTNSVSSIELHATNCFSIWGRNPNHILLDFYNTAGNAPFDYVASLNSVPAPTNTIRATQPTTIVSQTANISSSALGSADARLDLSLGRYASGMVLGLVGVLLGAGLVGI